MSSALPIPTALQPNYAALSANCGHPGPTIMGTTRPCVLGTGVRRYHRLQEPLHSGLRILQRSLSSHLPVHATHRQSRGAADIAKYFPRLRWRRFVPSGLARWGSIPRVEAQLGGTILPKWLVGVVAHTRLSRRHPATGLLRPWATRRAQPPADTCNGFKVLVRACGVGLAERAYLAARTIHNTG